MENSETLRYIKHSQIRGMFVLFSILSCGIGLIPWLLWEIFKK